MTFYILARPSVSYYDSLDAPLVFSPIARPSFSASPCIIVRMLQHVLFPLAPQSHEADGTAPGVGSATTTLAGEAIEEAKGEETRHDHCEE